MKRIRIALAVPAYRSQIHTGHLQQLHNLIAACAGSVVAASQQKHTDRLLIGNPPVFLFAGIIDIASCSIAKARNLILDGSLRSNALDWVLMCDADTYFPGNGASVLRMIAGADKRGAAVVVAPVMRRDGIYNVVGRDGDEFRMVRPPEFRGRVLEVARAGTAFMALNIEWFREKWPKHPWFKFEQIDGADGQPDEISEDHYMCDRVRERGGIVLCDGRIEAKHEGAPYPIEQQAAPEAVTGGG